MNKEEVMALIEGSVTKAMEGLANIVAARIKKEAGGEQKAGEGDPPAAEVVTKEDVAAMVEEAVTKTVKAELEPILKARGLANNLNDEKPMEKEAADTFDGLFA